MLVVIVVGWLRCSNARDWPPTRDNQRNNSTAPTQTARDNRKTKRTKHKAHNTHHQYKTTTNKAGEALAHGVSGEWRRAARSAPLLHSSHLGAALTDRMQRGESEVETKRPIPTKPRAIHTLPLCSFLILLVLSLVLCAVLYCSVCVFVSLFRCVRFRLLLTAAAAAAATPDSAHRKQTNKQHTARAHRRTHTDKTQPLSSAAMGMCASAPAEEPNQKNVQPKPEGTKAAATATHDSQPISPRAQKDGSAGGKTDSTHWGMVVSGCAVVSWPVRQCLSLECAVACFVRCWLRASVYVLHACRPLTHT